MFIFICLSIYIHTRIHMCMKVCLFIIIFISIFIVVFFYICTRTHTYSRVQARKDKRADPIELAALEKVNTHLLLGKPARSAGLSTDELELIKGMIYIYVNIYIYRTIYIQNE
jgi:zona occludens toxin (predicted ATPase)